MVQLQQYWTNTAGMQRQKDLPLLNSMFVEQFSRFSPNAKDTSFKAFMKWVRRSPFVIGFFSVIATDMLSDAVEFTPVGKGSGRNKVLRAEQFWEANHGVEVAEETIYDLLSTGIGYNWLGKLSDLQLKEFCDVVVRETSPELKSMDREFKAMDLVKNLKQNSPDQIAKKLRHVASTTMTIHSDGYETIDYMQRVGMRTKLYDKEDIIVFKLMPLDGKVYPFPPMEAVMAEVYLLWLITQNYVSWFENGGKPDVAFILPKELAGSKNYKTLIETLQKYKRIQNKHGNLVFTGELTIQKLAEVEQQMENKDLGLYLVSVLAMMLGVPVSRLPFLVGKAAAGGDAGGLADSGYWRKISVWQSKLEGPYNRDLWVPYFGVKMKFRRGYLQDEVRETQNEVQKNSVAEQRLHLGLWTVEAAGQYLHIDPDVLKEAQAQKKQRQEDEMKSGLLMQNQDNNGNVIPEPDHRAKAKKKQDTQNTNQKKAGGKRINP